MMECLLLVVDVVAEDWLEELREADHLLRQGHADWTLRGQEGVLVLAAVDGLTPVSHIPPNVRDERPCLTCKRCDAMCQMPRARWWLDCRRSPRHTGSTDNWEATDR